MYELMGDLYANYFCQKFFVALGKEDRVKFLCYIRPFGKFIATGKVGTYPLQAIIESIVYEEEKYVIIDTFKNDVIELSMVIIFLNIILRNLKELTLSRR